MGGKGGAPIFVQLLQGQHVIAETRRLSAIELGICPGFGDHERKLSTRWLRKSRIWHKISQIIRFRRSKPGARLLRESR
jgi:hypothetical protein